MFISKKQAIQFIARIKELEARVKTLEQENRVTSWDFGSGTPAEAIEKIPAYVKKTIKGEIKMLLTEEVKRLEEALKH